MQNDVIRLDDRDVLMVYRASSTEPKEGYIWDEVWGLWFENDELLRAKIMAQIYESHEHHGSTSGETRAPEEPKRDTSVRDAVHANR